MLFLVFSISQKYYAIQAEQIVEVLPNLTTDNLESPLAASTPDYFAGIINCRGTHLPVIDLCQLLNDSPCPNLISSRIILLHNPLQEKNLKIIGLLAEKITETKTIKGVGEAPPASSQFNDIVEKELSDPTRRITLFDPVNVLSKPLNQLLHYL